jgi:hypothetical protein
MSSISASAALAAQKAIKAALAVADNALFIADADRQILAAIALDKKFISITTFGEVNPHYIYKYYTNLGYDVDFPDLIQGQKFQPADLFGEFWLEYWEHTLLPSFHKGPIRIVIRPSKSGQPPVPPADSFLLLENGDFFELEDGSGAILLE